MSAHPPERLLCRGALGRGPEQQESTGHMTAHIPHRQAKRPKELLSVSSAHNDKKAAESHYQSPKQKKGNLQFQEGE